MLRLAGGFSFGFRFGVVFFDPSEARLLGFKLIFKLLVHDCFEDLTYLATFGKPEFHDVMAVDEGFGFDLFVAVLV